VVIIGIGFVNFAIVITDLVVDYISCVISFVRHFCGDIGSQREAPRKSSAWQYWP